MLHTRKTTIADSVLELPPIVVKSCAAHNRLKYFHDTSPLGRGHLVGVSRTRKTTLTGCVLELPPIVIKSFVGHNSKTL